MSSDASRCLSSALGIDLSGQFVPRLAKTLMRSSAAKFWEVEVGASEKVFSDHFAALNHGEPCCPEVQQANMHNIHYYYKSN